MAVDVARMSEKRMHGRIWWRNMKERNHMERMGVVGKMIFKKGLNAQCVVSYCFRSLGL